MCCFYELTFLNEPRLKIKLRASAATTHSTYLQRSQVFDIWEVMGSSHLEAGTLHTAKCMWQFSLHDW